MKILFISNDPSMFDEQSTTRARMREYAKVFGELHIISPARGSVHKVEEGPLTLHPIHGNRLLALWRMVSYGERVVREQGIESISAQDPFEHGLIATAIARKTGVRLHMQIHTDFLSPWFARLSPLNFFRRIIADTILPHAEGIRVVSKRVKDSLISRYGTRIAIPSVIPLTVSTVLPAPTTLPPHSFSFACMTIGRLEKEKRMEDVLRAIALAGPQVGLFVVGDGKERVGLELLAKFLGIEKRVIFLGWRTDALALLQSAQAYVQASVYEGYGRTLIEAALAHVPIVTTNVGVVGEVLIPGTSALVAPTKNAKALSGLIRAVAGDRALQEQLKEAGYVTAERHVQSVGSLSEAVHNDLERLVRSGPKKVSSPQVKNASSGHTSSKLLLVTQVVDREDLYLGFFHRWVEELAQHFAHIEVVCLKEGKHDFPEHVRVHSLGKEKGRELSFVYAFRFLRYVWKLRNDYDVVFVHMNQEYLLIAGWLWKLLKKKMYLWRNHYAGSWMTDVATLFCTKVFYTSKFSYTAKSPRGVRMPVGVDTTRFSPDSSVVRVPRSVLFFGRMMESKRPGLVIDALTLLAKKNVDFTASFYGSPPPGGEQYVTALRQRVADAGLSGKIQFYPGVPNDKAVDVFRRHQIYVNAGRSGMLDKMLFEAAASGCQVIAGSDDWKEFVGENSWFDGSASMLADVLERSLSQKQDLDRIQLFVTDHSLAQLAECVRREI